VTLCLVTGTRLEGALNENMLSGGCLFHIKTGGPYRVTDVVVAYHLKDFL
jgi:hypothetical protein